MGITPGSAAGGAARKWPPESSFCSIGCAKAESCYPRGAAGGTSPFFLHYYTEGVLARIGHCPDFCSAIAVVHRHSFIDIGAQKASHERKLPL